MTAPVGIFTVETRQTLIAARDAFAETITWLQTLRPTSSRRQRIATLSAAYDRVVAEIGRMPS